MSTKKNVKKFCSLSKYIEQTDKALYQVITDLCLQSLLRPVPGTGGITFLYPSDKKYVQKIINAAFGPSPEVAINMLKSLILHDHYPTLESFGEKVVNRLNQKIDVKKITDKEAIFVDKISVVPDKKFIPLNRDNIAVYLLSGGEIPLNGTTVQVERKMPSKSGGSSFNSDKKQLQKFLEETCDLETCDNIYVKKVYLQIKYLLKHSLDLVEVLDYLGNDEFSDSYLLDMYCDLKHPECFYALHSAMTQDQFKKEIANINKSHYVRVKQRIIGRNPTPNKDVNRDPDRMKEIQTPAEFRSRVLEAYRGDKKRLAKDLFIVFCNVARDLWQHSHDEYADFNNFCYIVHNVYNDPMIILKLGFNIESDMNLYGTLLKSDVFLYTPQASFLHKEVPYPIPKDMPVPVNLNLFSLCGYINRTEFPSRSNFYCGGSTVDYSYLFEDLKDKPQE